MYEEPLYITTLEFQPISVAKWSAAIALIASKASLISRLLLNEIPDTIEDRFKQLNLTLLNICGDFWHRAKRLAQTMDPLPQIPVSGIPVKSKETSPLFGNAIILLLKR